VVRDADEGRHECGEFGSRDEEDVTGVRADMGEAGVRPRAGVAEDDEVGDRMEMELLVPKLSGWTVRVDDGPVGLPDGKDIGRGERDAVVLRPWLADDE
jgi:hypothetical protein